MRLKTSLRSLPSCDNGTNDGDDNGEHPAPVSEGDAQDVQPIPAITNAEVEKRYTFRLSLDGERWIVRNNKTNKYMDRYGNEFNGLKVFGSDKNKAYELIKQKIEKEQEDAK